eukprot:NODE_94_length_21525_cov_0.751003.p4 type:complete len:603 gc:universal NODE_94_length_21525_cov_0.751003:14640-16448(+)
MSFLFKSWSTQVGEKISSCGTLDLHRYKDGYIFVPQNKEFIDNIIKRIKTLKIPGILNCKVENDQILVSELTPLSKMHLSQELLILGVHQLYKTLRFLHTQNLVHGNLSEDSIFVVNGEFKLFGLDLCSPISSNLLYKSNLLKISTIYPANPDPSSIDAILLYKLCAQLGLESLVTQQTLMRWPEILFDHWLISLSEGLSNFTILNPLERQKVLEVISRNKNNLPKDLTLKIVADLINAYLFANGGKHVLMIMISILPNLSPTNTLNDRVFDLFSAKDVDDRIIVLEHIGEFKVFLNEQLCEKILKIFSADINNGNPKYREFSMRSLVTISEFVSQKLRDNELIRLVTQYQLDPEPIIRTNSAIGLGKIAPNLSSDVRKRIVPVSIMRGLRDPFPPCRAANLTALSALSVDMSEELCATQLLPIVAPQTVDKDRLVRDQALKCLDSLVKRIKEFNPPSPDEKPYLPEESTSWGFSISKYVGSSTTAKPTNTPLAENLVAQETQLTPASKPIKSESLQTIRPNNSNSMKLDVKPSINDWNLDWEDESESTKPLKIDNLTFSQASEWQNTSWDDNVLESVPVQQPPTAMRLNDAAPKTDWDADW